MEVVVVGYLDRQVDDEFNLDITKFEMLQRHLDKDSQ